MFKGLTIFIVFTALLFQSAAADIINIGIYHNSKITSFTFHPIEGSYSVFTEHGKLLELDNSELLELQFSNNGVSIKSIDQDYGIFKKVRFIGKAWENSFKVKPNNSKKNKIYEDNLFVTPHNYYNYFQLINNIEINNYVAGVVESEVGRSPPPEYFKLQAIICRTYALKNIKRHQAEGFSLCDKVHCQAYNKKPTSELINKAALETNNTVIVDSDIDLIVATFYSNCGGETAKSEEVWREKLYYLRTVKDTFCLHENNAVWEKEISKEKWINYLINNGFPKGSIQHECDIEYFQNCREQFFENQNMQIPFTKIRSDFHLKSAQFDVIPNGEYVTLKGKGFGHGVGLCQEGAMEMAKRGYTYGQILHFYYKNVHMINLESLSFFKADY